MYGVFEALQPKIWVHGHHHVAYREQWMGCQMIGLGDNETPLEQQTLVFDTSLLESMTEHIEPGSTS